MKKILGIFFLLQILWIPNGYANELPTISVGSFDVYVGEKIVVPITIKNNPGCSYLGIKVSYDENGLEYIDSKLKGLENADMKNIQKDDNVITLYAISFQEDKSMDDNDVIAEITFMVKEKATTSTLRVDVTDFGGNDLVDYEFRENDGIIRIVDKRLSNTKEDLTQYLSPSTDAVIIWKSMDEDIAEVDERGQVFFSNQGTTTITGIDSDGNIVVEKEYTVVDEVKQQQSEEKQKNQEFFIFISFGVFLILCCILIFIRKKIKK